MDNGYNGSEFNGNNEANTSNSYNGYTKTQQYDFYSAKPEAPKKKNSFGRKLVNAVCYGLVFGIIAGASFFGINRLGNRLFPSKTIIDENNGKTNVTIQSTSNNGVAELTDVSEIAANVMPGIVAITNTSTVTTHNFFGQTQSYDATSRGSGIILTADSNYLYIATNYHVINGAKEITVQFCDDSAVKAEVKGSYSSKDLAVVMVKLADIKAETKNVIKQASIGDSKLLKPGEPAIAIGNALGYGQSVTTGVISALGRSVDVSDSGSGYKITHDNLIQTDAAINPGNSGGALLNKNGEVIGINSVKYTSTSVEGIGYAIPMEDALPILTDIINEVPAPERGYLGIVPANVTAEYAEAFNMPVGVYVNSVYKNSGADKAGLKQGDIITAVGDREIKNADELKDALSAKSVGDTVKLTVSRQNGSGYDSIELELTLSAESELIEKN